MMTFILPLSSESKSVQIVYCLLISVLLNLEIQFSVGGGLV